MSTIEVAVAGRGIQVKQGYEKPSAGDVNTCEVSLAIESGGVWDSLPNKRVTFSTRTASVTVDYAPTITVPHEVMASPGALYLTLTGYDADGIEVARTHRMTYPIEVAKAGADEGAEPAPATLDVVSRIDNLASTLEQSETTRQEAFESAQNERSSAFQSNMNQWSQDVAKSVSQVSIAIEKANRATSDANNAATNATEAAINANNAAAQVTAQYAEDKQAWDAEVSAAAGEARAAGAEVKADYEQNVVSDYERRTAEWQSQLDEKATKDELAATIHKQEATDLMQDKRIENLEAAAKGVLYREDVDTTEAYTKTVPTGAQKWASLDKVGGKTVVNDGELVSAEVVEVESRGKNLLDITATFPYTASGFTYTKNGNAITASGTATSWPFMTIGKFAAKKDDVVYVSFNRDSNQIAPRLVENGTTNILRIGYDGRCVVPNDMTVRVDVQIGSNTSSGTFTISNIQIEKGTKVTEYKPYLEPVSFPIHAEVREMCPGYGWSAGTACNEIDFGRKVYVQRVGSVDLGTLEWTRYSNGRMQAFSPYHTHANGPYDSVTNCACSKYVATSAAIIESSSPVDKTVALGGNSNTFCVYDSDYTDEATFKTAMQGVMLYYELATPIEVDLSNVLPDDHFIEVEAGGTVTFKQASTQLPVPSSITYQISTSEVIANA